MLAGVLERLLKRYLSRWLSVTHEHLQVLQLGVWRGELEFTQLHFLSAVLDQMQMPGLGVKLKKGMIGSLRIKCNWARLTTQPVHIALSDVYLLGELDPQLRRAQQQPSADDLAQRIDPAAIEHYIRSQKAAILEAAEAAWSDLRAEAGGGAAQSYMGSLTQSLVASVLDNLSVSVQRIHVCIATPTPYPELPTPVSEPTTSIQLPNSSADSSSTSSSAVAIPAPLSAASSASSPSLSPDPAVPPSPRPAAPHSPSSSSPSESPFPLGWSLGVLLHDLSVSTTDEEGRPTFVKSTGSHVCKRVRLEGLAVYLSSNATPLPDAAAGSDEYFMRLMRKPFRTRDDEQSVAEESDASLSSSESDAEAKPASTSADAAAVSVSGSPMPLSSASTSPVLVAASAAESPSSPHSPPPLRLSSSLNTYSPGAHKPAPEEQLQGPEYILCPCDATVKLRLRKRHATGGDEDGPHAALGEKDAKLGVEVELSRLQVEFSARQCLILQSLGARTSSSAHALRHAPYVAPLQRPGRSSQVTRAWWSYALGVTRRQVRQQLLQWDWHHIKAYRRNLALYTPLYQAVLAGRATAAQLSEMSRIEEAWEAHQIVVWRSIIARRARVAQALAHVKRSKRRGRNHSQHGHGHGRRRSHSRERNASVSLEPDSPKPRAGMLGWLGSWLPGGSSSAESDAPLTLTPEEREQLLEVLGYDPLADDGGGAAGSGPGGGAKLALDVRLGFASVTLFQSRVEPPRVGAPDPSLSKLFPLAPRTRTMRQAFLVASLEDFVLSLTRGVGGMSVQLSLDQLLLQDRAATDERFAALIVPRSLSRRMLGDQTPWRTPAPMRHAGVEASPLMLPEAVGSSSSSSDVRKAVSFAPGSPEFGLLRSPEPPLLQLRLSYHFPSTLPQTSSSTQAHIDLWLATQPLDVVYSAGAIDRVKQFAALPSSSASASEEEEGEVSVLWQELEIAAMNALQDLKRRSAAKLDYVLHHHVRVNLQLNIQAPTLLIHHHGARDAGPSLAFNLGHVRCVTQEQAASTPDATRKGSDGGHERTLSGSATSGPAPSEEPFYDRFRLLIENMDVQLVTLDAAAPIPGRMREPPALSLPASVGAQEDYFGRGVSVASSSSAAASPSITAGASPRNSRQARRAWLARRRTLLHGGASRWRSTRAPGCGTVVDAFTPTITLWASVLPSDTSFPRMKIATHLPPLKLHLSSAKMKRIVDIISSFPSATPPPPPPAVPFAQPPLQRAASMGPGLGSPAPPRRESSTSSSRDRDREREAAKRRTSSSFQLSRESALHAASIVNSDSKQRATPQLPAEWVMLHFHLTASQLSLDLSFDYDVAPDSNSFASPSFSPVRSGVQEPTSSSVDLVSFLLEGVDLSLTQYPYRFALEAQVHGLFVEDGLNREHEAFRYLISSAAAPVVMGQSMEESAASVAPTTTPAAAQSALTGLIYLKFHHSTKPAASSAASSLDSLQVDFNTLQFNFNRSTFQLLLEFVQPLLDAIGGDQSTAAAAAASSPLQAPMPLSDDPLASMSRSVDFGMSMLQGPPHSRHSSNLSASLSSLPPPSHSHSSSASSFPPTVPGTPHTPDRGGSSGAATPAAHSRGVSFASPAAATLPGGANQPASQQQLLARISEKILNDGEIGSRANRNRMTASSSQLKVHARINLISVSLNEERDDGIASLARTELHGLDVSLNNQDCPCGGCMQLHATLANLTLYELTSAASDIASSYSRRSDPFSARAAASTDAFMSHAHSSHSLEREMAAFSPLPIDAVSRALFASGSSSGGSGSILLPGGVRARRIASKRQSSDTALVTVSFTQHALVMDAPPGQPTSTSCPLRFRTLRNLDPEPAVPVASLSNDQTLDVSVSSAQLVLLPDFLLRLQSYLERSMLKQASDRAAESAKRALEEIKQASEANCSLFKYSLQIDNPLVFLPHTTTAPLNRPQSNPVSSPQPPRASPARSPIASPVSGRSSPHGAAFFSQHSSHGLEEVRESVTEYLVLDLGKISLANSFELSEDRFQLLPPDLTSPDLSASASASLSLLSPTASMRRRRRSLAPSVRAPMQQLQMRLSAVNLMLARAPAAPTAAAASHDPNAASSEDVGLVWSDAHKKKIFEDVNVECTLSLVMLTPHLRFGGLADASLRGTVSTICMHVSEELLRFAVGVCAHELAPMLAPTAPTSSDESIDDDMEVETEDEEWQVEAPITATATAVPAPVRPPPPLSRTASTASVGSAAAGVSSVPLTGSNADSVDDALSDAMAAIDEELTDDESPAPLTRTSESVAFIIDLSFEGVLIDIMLTPSQADEAEEQFASVRQSRGSMLLPPHPLPSASFLSPQHGSSASFLSPSPGLPALFQTPGNASMPAPTAATSSTFTFAPVVAPRPSPQAQSFLQVRARTLQVTYKLTHVVRFEAQQAPLRSALTSVELSLGHLSLEDMRATHALLRQVIGGHHDLKTQHTMGAAAAAATSRVGSNHSRASSVAVDLSAMGSTFLSPPRASISLPDLSDSPTRLPDLKVKFEQLDVEQTHALPDSLAQPLSDEMGHELPPPAAPKSVTVEMSVDVEFTAPRLVIAPSFLSGTLNLIDAYSRVMEAEGASDEQHAAPQPNPSRQLDAEAETADAESSQPTAETRIHARIRDPQIWLMSDAEASPSATFAASPNIVRPQASMAASSLSLRPSDSRESIMLGDRSLRPLSCVVLRANLELSVKLVESTHMHASLSDIEALMCYRANQLRLTQLNPMPVPIFQPFAVTLEYELGSIGEVNTSPQAARAESFGARPVYPPPASMAVRPLADSSINEHRLIVEVGRLDSCFSFLQMSSAANIILGLVNAAPANSSPAPASTSEAKPSQPASSPLSFLDEFKGLVQLRTSGIHLRLVNDAPGYYVPLLSFSLTPLLLSVLDTSRPESVHFSQLHEQRSSGGDTPAYLSSSRLAEELARSSSTASSGVILVSGGLEANYYNRQLGAWERFLTRWCVDARADHRNAIVQSKQMLELAVTPDCVHAIAQAVDSLQAHFLAVLAAQPKAVADSALSPIISSDRKASYFRVRNETGSRLRFWSVEVEQSGPAAAVGTVDAAGAKVGAALTVEHGQEETLALRQYIGVGGFGMEAEEEEEKVNTADSDEKSEEKDETNARWLLYRSPMVGLQLEAGASSERWSAWRPIGAVPLVTNAAGESADPASQRSNLTLHPLLPADDDHEEDIAPSAIACHLVRTTDADGSTAQVLVVSSALLLVNRTYVDIELCLVDTHAECVLWQRSVRSGETLPLPVLTVPWRRVKLLLRPVTGWRKREWNWSTSGLRLTMLQYESATHSVLKCHSTHSDDSPSSHSPISPLHASSMHHGAGQIFCCGLNLFSTDAPASASGDSTLPGISAPRLYTIALDAPLTFKNLLGADVAYRVTVRERRPGASFLSTSLSDLVLSSDRSGFLPSKQEVHWYDMDLGAGSSAVVSIQLRRASGEEATLNGSMLVSSRITTPHALSRSTSYTQLLPASADGDWSADWSEPVVIHSTSRAARPSPQLLLADAEGRLLRIQLEYSSSSDSLASGVYPYARAGLGLVTAFVPFWIANRSGLPLLYASMGSDELVQRPHLAAGQSAASQLHAEQLMRELEGVDELALQAGIKDANSSAAAGGSEARAWFLFRGARQSFGAETRAGLHSLLADPQPAWMWTPALARQPLDEGVFPLSPLTQLEEELASSAQLSFLPPSQCEKLRAVIRLPNTEWSLPFSVDAVGWDGAIELREKRASEHTRHAPLQSDSVYDLPRADGVVRAYRLGVSILRLPHLRYRHTNVIRLTPRFVISNHTLHTLEYRQTGCNDVRTLAPKQSAPIHWLELGARSALSLRVAGYGWQWAARRYGIALESVGVFSVRLRNAHTHESAVLHVWTRLQEATFEITVLATWESRREQAIQSDAALQQSPQQMASSMSLPQMNNLQASWLANSMTASELHTASLMASQSGVAAPVPASTGADDRDLSEKLSSDSAGVQEPVPYRIENFSLRTLVFHQADEPRLRQRLLPMQTCPYAWDEPMGRKEIVLACIAGAGDGLEHDDSSDEQRIGSFSLDRIARYEPVTLRRGPVGAEVSDSHLPGVQDQVLAQVYADGRVRVLQLVELTYANSAGLSGAQVGLTAAAVRRAAAGLPALPAHAAPASSATTGAAPAAAAPEWSVELRLAGLGLSLITHVVRAGPNLPAAAAGASVASLSMSMHASSIAAPTATHPLALLGSPYTRQELLYLSVQGVRVRVSDAGGQQTLRAGVGHLQLDNQLADATYPVVLCSLPRSQRSGGWSLWGGRRKPPLPELNLDDEFFLLSGAHAPRRSGAEQRACWLSMALLRSPERSTPDFLFMPGLAVRMHTIKLCVEEKLVSHILRFVGLLTPAVALLSQPKSRGMTLPAQPHHFEVASDLQRQSSQALLGMALAGEYATASPLQGQRGEDEASASEGSLTPRSLRSGSLLSDDDERDGGAESHGVVRRLSVCHSPLHMDGHLPPSSIDFSHLSSQPHPSSIRAEAGGPVSSSIGSDSASPPTSRLAAHPQLERPVILYFQHLLIEPIDVQISLSASGERDAEVDAALGGSMDATPQHPLRVLLLAAGATFLNFDSAPLRFGELQLPHVFASADELSSLVVFHYLKQATRAVYALLGSSDFLGNPVALFSAISAGVGELVYQPVAGLASSPVGVVSGTIGGVKAFGQHALFGITGAARSVLSSIAKGLSSAARAGAKQSLLDLPVRGWRVRGVRGFFGGCMRASLGLTARGFHSLSAGVDRVRALVSPLPRLSRARPPLLFQSGIRPRLYSSDVAAFVQAYFVARPEETFVALAEQSATVPAPPPLPATSRAFRFGMPMFAPPSQQQASVGSSNLGAWSSPHQQQQQQQHAADLATSSSILLPPTGSSSASPFTPQTLIAPPGGRFCLLLTTHSLVLFLVFASSSRRPAQLLRDIPLQQLSLPLEIGAGWVDLCIEPPDAESAFSRTRLARSVSNRRLRALRGNRNVLLALSGNGPRGSSNLGWWWLLFRSMGHAPVQRAETMRVPIAIAQPMRQQIHLLATAARANVDAHKRESRAFLGASIH